MSTRLVFFLILSAVLTFNSHAQLTLEQCQEKARANYPLVNQAGLIEQSKEFNIANASKTWLPQASFSARATWQSEVIELPFSMPGIGSVDQDQYQAVLEVGQVIWDGGASGARKNLIRSSSDMEAQKLEVDLYTLKERINQLYFGLLLLREQVALVDILDADLESNYNRVKAAMDNGVASQSDLDAIRVEQLKATQMRVEIHASEQAFLSMLSAFTGESISSAAVLVKPSEMVVPAGDGAILRPELSLFKAQSDVLENQKKLVKAGNMPRLALFAQGGYGKPGLNMLSNEFSPYFIGGVKLSWSVIGYYSQRNEINLLTLNQSTADIQKETFLFNIRLKLAQQQNEIDRLAKVMESDNEIIQLRKNILKATEAKVESGTATASDLVRDINAVNRAMQDKALHEAQWLNAIYSLKNTTNN